jgi:hypothetical protein
VVEDVLGADVDTHSFEDLGESLEKSPERKYSPGDCRGAKKFKSDSNPDYAQALTSKGRTLLSHAYAPVYTAD